MDQKNVVLYFCRNENSWRSSHFLSSAAYHIVILLFCSRSNLTNTQGTDVDARCPLLSNSAQTISHFTTLEWSLQQFHSALHKVRGDCIAQRLSPLWVPVYEFEMVTKSQFHPRRATVMVLSGDCSNLKMQQKLLISQFIAFWGCLWLESNTDMIK